MHLLKTLSFATLILASSLSFAEKTTGEVVDDSLVQAEVKAKLVGEDFLSGMGVNIETRKGVVQLGGFVDDANKSKKLAALAATVDGVAQVDNQMHEKSGERSAGQAIDDGLATSRVKAAIADADLGDGLKVNVDTYNGQVLLTGFVDDAGHKEKAGEIAAGDKNTKDVINGIFVLD